MGFDFRTNIDVIFERLEKFFVAKTVVGESIQVGAVTLIPLVSLSFGMGAGGGSDPKNPQSEGGGGGIGAKASPSAIIVIKGEQVEVVPISSSKGLEKIIEMVPEVVSKIMAEQEETPEE